VIFTLLRRDPAVRVLPLMPAGFGVLGFMAGTAALEGGAAPPPLFDAQDAAVNLAMVMAWALINYFAVSRMHEIATPLEMAMPIDARTLWAVRVAVMTATVSGGIVGFCMGFVWAHGAPIARQQVALAFNIGALTVLIPCLYTAVRIRTPKWGMPLPVFVPLLGVLMYGYVRSGLATFAPGAAVLVLAAALAATTYARMPKNFELVSRNGSGAEGLRVRFSLEVLDGVPGVGRILDGTRALRPPAWFTQSQKRLLVALVLLLNVFALSMSPFVLVLVLALAQFSWFVRTVNGGAQLAPLPISRARIFLFATVPGLLVGAAGLAGLIAYFPHLSWAQAFSSKQAALGFALYAFVWWFTLSLLLDTMETPPAPAAGGGRRYPMRARYLLGAAVAIALVAVTVIERTRDGDSLRLWEITAGRPFLQVLAETAPVGAPPLWGLALLAAVAAFAGLRRAFFRVELVPATDF